MNITEPIRRAARLTPDDVAIIRADDTPLSYAGLERAIDRMAAHAMRLGLRAGDIVGLVITGPDESLGLVLALALARIGVATAHPSLPAERLRLSFQLAQPGRPIDPGRVRFDAGWMPNATLAPDQAPPPDGARDGPPVEIHQDGATLCGVFASSGTTGVAKHVPISHDLMARRVYSRWLGFGGGRAVRIIAISLSGTWGFATALRTLWEGGTLVLSNPADAAVAIRRHRVTSISASPVALRTMLDALPEASAPFPSLATIEVGGSMFPAPLRQRASARLCASIVSYLGSSEAGGIASAPVAALGSRPGAVGITWPGVRVQAVDAHHIPLPAGAEGILRIGGDMVAACYLWDDGTPAESFRDGWFYSGDTGAVWPDGMITLSGRTSELINAGGVKVSPHVIESALLALPLVTDAAAFGVPDASGVEQIWAAIVARTRIDDAVLNGLCQVALPGRSPKVILQMKALPRNANGKIERMTLVEIALRMADAQPAMTGDRKPGREVAT